MTETFIDIELMTSAVAELDLDLAALMPLSSGMGVPDDFVPGARSVIVAARCYKVNAPPLEDDQPRGSIAPYTWSNFYRPLHKALRRLARIIGARVFRCSVNGRLPEKRLAVAAGLGGFGLNTIVLTADYGSLVVLGVLVCDLIHPGEGPTLVMGRPARGCLECGACVRACPTGALDGKGGLDTSRCIQALCTEDRLLSDSIRAAWGKRLYGCSTCQDVCPLNRGVLQRRPAPGRGFVGPDLPLLPFLSMSEKTFKARVSGNQMAARWVPYRALRRNAILALAAYDDEGVRRTLRSFIERCDDRLLRDAASWSLSAAG